MPALFTRTSILPKCSMVVAIRSLPPSGVETSLSSAIASPPRDRMRSATCSAMVESFPYPDTSVPRSFTTTRAPRSARSSTYARPSPRPAPVTTATFPSREIGSAISLSSSGKSQCSRFVTDGEVQAIPHRHAPIPARTGGRGPASRVRLGGGSDSLGLVFRLGDGGLARPELAWRVEHGPAPVLQQPQAVAGHGQASWTPPSRQVLPCPALWPQVVGWYRCGAVLKGTALILRSGSGKYCQPRRLPVT